MRTTLSSHYASSCATISDRREFQAKDFFVIQEQFVESQNVLTDLHSLLSVISQTAIDRDDVKHATNMLTSTKTDDANMSEIATE